MSNWIFRVWVRAGETGGGGRGTDGTFPPGPKKCQFQGKSGDPKKNTKKGPFELYRLLSELYRWSLNILYPGSWNGGLLEAQKHVFENILSFCSIGSFFEKIVGQIR